MKKMKENEEETIAKSKIVDKEHGILNSVILIFST